MRGYPQEGGRTPHHHQEAGPEADRQAHVQEVHDLLGAHGRRPPGARQGEDDQTLLHRCGHPGSVQDPDDGLPLRLR